MKCETKQVLGTLLLPYKERIESEIEKFFLRLGSKSAIRDACEYALKIGGKRFRPILVYLVAEALHSEHPVDEAALAVELFHTASLIADDLPCMDDDPIRRENPSTHTKFGESTAILSTYAMIAAGYDCLARNAKVVENDHVGVLAIRNVSKNTGILGAAGGQALDLAPPDMSAKTLCQIIEKKTSTLFEISFVLGWLFGLGKVGQLSEVEKMAAHFGMAFQIADDLQDLQQDKNQGHGLNYALILGEKAARERLQVEVELYQKKIQSLDLHSKVLTGIASMLLEQA